MGRNKHAELDQLIEEVARGARELSSIRDPELREAVRIALRIHEEIPGEPDAYTRIRMRGRVMGALRPRRATLRDNAWTALELIARPAPYIVRAVGAVAVVVVFAMGAVAASADTLPDDLLYPVKLSAEAVRLALSDSADDHAVIELSIAEHRLREAERLAANGRALDALVASAMYSQSVASAAADLAPAGPSDLTRQLETRFDEDRSRAQTLAATLRTDAKSAPAAAVLALIAKPTAVPGDVGMERVASTAAGVVEQLVRAAEPGPAPREREESESSPAPREREASESSPAPREREAGEPSAAPRAADRREAAPSALVRVTSGVDARKASEVLRALHKAAAETKAAADKAKAHHR